VACLAAAVIGLMLKPPKPTQQSRLAMVWHRPAAGVRAG
jgi:hypothetical protein